jgi:hypothetical protein
MGLFPETRRKAQLFRGVEFIARRFRLGLAAAKILANDFYPEFSMRDLINLPNYAVYVELMIDGVGVAAV